MNVDNFKNMKNLPELLNLSNEITNLINQLYNGKKIYKNQSKTHNQILKNPKMQLLKDKIENKVNLILNKLSESNINILLSEFIESMGKINMNDYISIQKAFYLKIQSDINFVKIYLEFFKIISNVYYNVFKFTPEFFYSIIEVKFLYDYKEIPLSTDFTFLEEYSEESRRTNHLIITKNLINLQLLNTSLKNVVDKILLDQNIYYCDIYYWFNNETISTEYKDIIKKKIINNTLPMREKILLDNLLDNKQVKEVKEVKEPREQKETKILSKNKQIKYIKEEKIVVDTLKLETENIIEEYFMLDSLDNLKSFVQDECKDALSKNKFCQYIFNKYFESSSDISTKILELMKVLVKKQILFKSNLSRGVLLIQSNWNEISLDFNNPTKKMKELLLCLKNMGITKALESLLKEYKIEFVESYN